MAGAVSVETSSAPCAYKFQASLCVNLDLKSKSSKSHRPCRHVHLARLAHPQRIVWPYQRSTSTAYGAAPGGSSITADLTGAGLSPAWPRSISLGPQRSCVPSNHPISRSRCLRASETTPCSDPGPKLPLDPAHTAAHPTISIHGPS